MAVGAAGGYWPTGLTALSGHFPPELAAVSGYSLSGLTAVSGYSLSGLTAVSGFAPAEPAVRLSGLHPPSGIPAPASGGVHPACIPDTAHFTGCISGSFLTSDSFPAICSSPPSDCLRHNIPYVINGLWQASRDKGGILFSTLFFHDFSSVSG